MGTSKQMKDGVFLVSLYIAMLLFAIYIPSSLFIIVFFMPIPFIIYAARYNMQHFLMMIGITAVIVFLCTIVTRNMLLSPLFVLTLVGGFAIGTGLKRKTPYETWIRGTIGFVIGLMFVFIYTQLVLEMNWAEEVDLFIEETFQNVSVIVNQFDSSEQINEQLKMLQEQMGIIKDLIPVGIAILAIVMAFLTQWFSYRIISQLEGKPIRFPPIRRLQFPGVVVWLYIIGIIVTLLEGNPSSTLFIGAQNIISLAGFLMILQGFSFLFFYVHHKNKSNVLPIIAVILSVLLPLFLYLIRLIGLIDMAFSLRNQMRKSKEDKRR